MLRPDAPIVTILVTHSRAELPNAKLRFPITAALAKSKLSGYCDRAHRIFAILARERFGSNAGMRETPQPRRILLPRPAGSHNA